ncbi:hypothetical protein SAMN05444170_2180 [Bradyrhizobium erythrophlei]|jgi:hypothetical protein|uniref:Uncharacterized protein n=1 Tax=Bradyrhizobium erythrophlei TaxID=1437360 RepID=A0A1M7TMU6_9BRAD|nr:hypothetical protein SAMN05444170_2180 [Bradyrhizobium erythrophlei]
MRCRLASDLIQSRIKPPYPAAVAAARPDMAAGIPAADRVALDLKRTSRRRDYFAAVTMISTLYFAAASLTSTVARAGVLPGETQASHTAFISGNVFMSVM